MSPTRRAPRLRRQGAGIACALAGLLWLSTAGIAQGEGEPVESYESLPELVEASDAIVVGTSVAIEEGPKLGPNGWLEGVWAKVTVDDVVWTRQLVPNEIVLDGLSADSDVPPVGERAVMILRKEAEAPAPHYRLVVPSSMVILGSAGGELTGHAPEYMQSLGGLPADAVIDRLSSMVPSNGTPTTTDDALSPLLLGLAAFAFLALVLFSGLAIGRGRRSSDTTV